jgi:drug/metabolite transporter (DMT)-like permease
MWATLSDRMKGTILCLAGVMFLIPDSLCIQEINPSIPQHSVILYKYIGFTSVLTTAHVLSNPNDIWGSFKRLDHIGWMAGLIWGISNYLITYAFQTTSAANAVIIDSSSPLFSTIFTFFFLKEVIPLRTTVASCFCVICILIIFFGEISGGSILGIIAACGASSTLALYFVMLRYVELRDG